MDQNKTAEESTGMQLHIKKDSPAPDEATKWTEQPEPRKTWWLPGRPRLLATTADHSIQALFLKKVPPMEFASASSISATIQFRAGTTRSMEGNGTATAHVAHNEKKWNR